MTIVGALIGILLKPQPDHRFEAEAVARVGPSPPGPGLIERVLSNPEVITTAIGDSKVANNAEDVMEHMTVAADPEDGTVTVAAQGDSEQAASDLVMSLLAQSAAVARMSINQSEGAVDYSFGDFEGGRATWDSVPSSFSHPPEDESITSPGFTNAKALSVECPDRNCGPSVILRGLFLPDRVYTAVAYARSTASDGRLRMVFGQTPLDDYATGRARQLTPDWQRFDVRWRPSEIRSSAFIVIALEAEGGEFEIDSVVFADGDAPQRPSAERFRKAGHTLRMALVRSPVVSEPGSAPTSRSQGVWALIGGLTGFMITAAAALAGWLAYKRLPRDAGARDGL